MLKCEMPGSCLPKPPPLRLDLEPGTVLDEKSFADESQSGAKVSSGNGNQQLIRENENEQRVYHAGRHAYNR